MAKEINMDEIQRVKNQMLTQDNRSTSYPIFIVVEDKKVWGYSDCDDYDGKERKEEFDPNDLCATCSALYEENQGEMPEDDSCDEYSCGDTFNYYKIEKDVPNMRAAFFFTAEACNQHIEANGHHYNETAKSYAISGYYNSEIREVMKYLCGKDLQ